MKFKEKYNISPEFENLFTFKTKDDETEHEAKMLMFRFLSELEKLNGDKPFKKKDLAKALKTSPSYITQLFNGDKLINLTTLAKIQEAYKICFEIKAKPFAENYKAEIENTYKNFKARNNWIDNSGYWLHVSVNPNYEKGLNNSVPEKPVLKIA
jgi:transcriptional regulator with XRE-family HTH domain